MAKLNYSSAYSMRDFPAPVQIESMDSELRQYAKRKQARADVLFVNLMRLTA